MSRIGQKPIQIPAGVTVSIDGPIVKVKGPKGELSYKVRPEVEPSIEGNEVIVKLKYQTKASPAYWGLTRALISSMVEGVTSGFSKSLELVGVGYRVKQTSPTSILLSVGFSHPVEFKAPEGITIKVEDEKRITVSGIDKQLVGLVCAKIRKVKKPEPYKGKGIKYDTEVIRRKAGKAGKVA